MSWHSGFLFHFFIVTTQQVRYNFQKKIRINLEVQIFIVLLYRNQGVTLTLKATEKRIDEHV